MFIKRNKSSLGGKDYGSVLLVHGKRVPAKRPPGRPAGDLPRKTVVVHEALANLSKLPPALLGLIAGYCQNPPGTPPPAETLPASEATPDPSVH